MRFIEKINQNEYASILKIGYLINIEISSPVSQLPKDLSDHKIA